MAAQTPRDPSSITCPSEPVATTTWPDFERELGFAIGILDRELLILDVKGSSAYVQFHATRSVVLAETVANVHLADADKLSDAQVTALLELGWRPPAGAGGDAAAAARQPGAAASSPNFSLELRTPDRCAEAARLAVRTLAGIHRVPGPDRLVYNSFDEQGVAVVLPGLERAGAARKEPVPRMKRKSHAHTPAANVRRRLLRELRALTRDPGAAFDEDGDLAFPIETGFAFVRVIDAPLVVRAWCTIAKDVAESPGLRHRLDEANARLPLVRLVLQGGAVFAIADFPAAPYRPEHLAQALASLTVAARRMGPQLGVDRGAASSDPEGAVSRS